MWTAAVGGFVWFCCPASLPLELPLLLPPTWFWSLAKPSTWTPADRRWATDQSDARSGGLELFKCRHAGRQLELSHPATGNFLEQLLLHPSRGLGLVWNSHLQCLSLAGLAPLSLSLQPSISPDETASGWAVNGSVGTGSWERGSDLPIYSLPSSLRPSGGLLSCHPCFFKNFCFFMVIIVLKFR